MHLGWYMARPTVENIGNFSDMKKKNTIALTVIRT